MTRILGRRSQSHATDFSAPAIGHGWSRLGGGTGLRRLFTAEMANEISWLLPAALLAVAFGVYLVFRGRLGRGEKAALTMFTGWLLVSAAGVQLHERHGPPVLHRGDGARRRRAGRHRHGVGVAISGRLGRPHSACRDDRDSPPPGRQYFCTATTLARHGFHGYSPRSRIAAAVAVLGLGSRRVVAAAATVGVLAAVGGTTAFSIATAATPHRGSIPTALKKGDAQLGNWMGDEATNPDLAGVLANTHTEWSAATNGSQSAAALEVSSGTSVMAIGGWSGDPVPTLQSFIDDVQAGKISYYIEAGRGRSFEEKGHGEVIYGPSRGAAHTREIADWVAKHYPGTRHRRIDGLPPDVAIRAGYHRAVASSQPSGAAPVDPPIPVPDVAGADATARGLPRRVDLTLRQRLIVDSSAIADLGLRTATGIGCRRGDAAAGGQGSAGPVGLVGAARRTAVLRRIGRREGPERCRFPLRRRCRGSRRARRIRSRNGSPTAACTTSGSTAASRRSIRRCATGAARMRATTSCMPSTGATTTDPIPPCA